MTIPSLHETQNEHGSRMPILPLTFGTMEIRLASTEAEIMAAQKLRWKVFYDEMGAQPTPEMLVVGRDIDPFDAFADHLLVLDHSRGIGQNAVVGTYRMIRSSVAAKHGGHYSASEFDISCLMNYPGEGLEVGRSCVDMAYRTRGTMQLLWQGIAAYVFEHNVSVLFGCASLPGTDPSRLALPLSYLYHYNLAPPAIRPRALPGRYVDMHRLPLDQVDPRQGMFSLPPLIKGYLRVGGFIGDGAVVDHQFNTTDVCIIVKRETIADRYLKHYERAKRGPELD